MISLTPRHASPPLPPPVDIHFHRKSQCLVFTWESGEVDRLDTSRLREACLCSSCRAAKLQALFVVAAPVYVDEVRFLGVAGLQLVFSDAHERGVFPWRYLRELAGRE